jgi:uncharacterized damage-inducible protein DinB
MELIPILIAELEREANITRKMLSIAPADKYNWRPHEKSMTMQNLVTHIAELPTWINLVLNTSELDFGTAPYEPQNIADTTTLLAYFEQCLADAKAQLQKTAEADLLPIWTLREGEKIYSSDTKLEVLRMVNCQIVHHRAQLGVYLRLHNIPIPASYGPSADARF